MIFMSPLYDFHCDVCSNEFEVFMTYDDVDQNLNPKKQNRCPKCDSQRTRKILKSVAVIYKADGFTLKKNESSE